MISRIKELDVQQGNIFGNDTLGRAAQVHFLADILCKTTGPFVMAMDSPWGTGKTTTVRMLKALMEEQEYKCLYFNAWKADHISDPLIPLVAEIVKGGYEGADASSTEILANVKKTAGAIGRLMLNVGARVATAGLVNADDLIQEALADGVGSTVDTVIDAYLKQEELSEKLRKELSIVVALLRSMKKKDTLIFFVDELDRCRPNFAVDLLERIKHIFDIPNVVFVLSVDLSQLSASVRSVYGRDLDSDGYLQRFFDLTFTLPRVKNTDFIKSLIKQSDFNKRLIDQEKDKENELAAELENFINLFSTLAELFGLSLRNRERCITRLGVMIEQTPPKHNLHTPYLAIFIVLRTVDSKLFHSILSKDKEPLDFFDLIKKQSRYPILYSESGEYFDLIEDYLLMADSEAPQAKKTLRELRALSRRGDEDNNGAADATQKLIYLTELQKETPRPTVFYNIIRKIDLAGSVQ